MHCLSVSILQSPKRGEVKSSDAGLESGGQSALQVSERPLPRVVIQSKNCLVYSCVYEERESVFVICCMCDNKVVPRYK